MFETLIGAALLVVGLAGTAACWLWSEASKLGDELGDAAALGFAQGAAEVMGGKYESPRSPTSVERQTVAQRFERATGRRQTGLRESLS